MKCAAETIFSLRGRNVSSSIQTVNQIGIPSSDWNDTTETGRPRILFLPISEALVARVPQGGFGTMMGL